MDRNALAELLQALESRRDAEERRREERYTALIERFRGEEVHITAYPKPSTAPHTAPPRHVSETQPCLQSKIRYRVIARV
ncbi:UNVERIFIED_CONTAM: hypothetical protein FKN15_069161 [Acipenser sinensis]